MFKSTLQAKPRKTHSNLVKSVKDSALSPLTLNSGNVRNFGDQTNSTGIKTQYPPKSKTKTEFREQISDSDAPNENNDVSLPIIETKTEFREQISDSDAPNENNDVAETSYAQRLASLQKLRVSAHLRCAQNESLNISGNGLLVFPQSVLGVDPVDEDADTHWAVGSRVRAKYRTLW